MHAKVEAKTIIAAVLCVLSSQGMSGQDAVTFTPGELPWKATPTTPGREQANMVGDSKNSGLYVMRVKLPPNYRQHAHSHPDDRSYTIMAGTWYIGWGEEFADAKLIPLPAESFYIEHGNRPHFVATKEDGAVIQISGTGPSGQRFVDPAHEPRK